jgi:hypothetical protein
MRRGMRALLSLTTRLRSLSMYNWMSFGVTCLLHARSEHMYLEPVEGNFGIK